MAQLEDHFTVFIRLPFARGDFVDPPPVAWSAAKERELWEILSRSSKGHEIDWKGLADQLNVTQAFLLQQAAWLYERQLSQVRAQMKRMGTRSSNTASPLPQSNTASVVGGQPMKRAGSGGSRVPTRIVTQGPAPETSAPGTPIRSKSSFQGRTTPQAGATHAKSESTSSRPLSRRTSKENEVASRTQSRRGSVQQQITRSPKQDLVHQVESSSEEDMTQSRMLHRRPNPAASRRIAPGRRSQHTRRPSAPQLEEEDEEDAPAFLPFSGNSNEATKTDLGTSRDPAATIRGGMLQARPSSHRRSTSERLTPQPKIQQDQSGLTSSETSASDPPADPRRSGPSHRHQQGRGHLPVPLSPRQQAALAAAAGLSPRLRKAGNGHGSESSPSMGSSFSDLDDASVTQSALEEALLSGMGNTTMTVGGGPSNAVGNVANRVSGISQALRSRYFDARASESQR